MTALWMLKIVQSEKRRKPIFSGRLKMEHGILSMAAKDENFTINKVQTYPVYPLIFFFLVAAAATLIQLALVTWVTVPEMIGGMEGVVGRKAVELMIDKLQTSLIGLVVPIAGLLLIAGGQLHHVWKLRNIARKEALIE